MINQLVIC